MTNLTATPPASSKPLEGIDEPELQLLLCAARTELDGAIGERIERLLQNSIDWAFLLDTAEWHGVLPLLYQTLKRRYSHAVPPAVLKQLQDSFQANSLRNLVLTQELIGLLRLFEERGIAAAPFKGPVLAISVYGNLALRQFGDLDILVRQQDFPCAIKPLLVERDYQPQWSHYRSPAREKAHFRAYGECEFRRNDGQVYVDIHGKLATIGFCDRAFDRDAVWEHFQPVCLNGYTALSLAPEDLLLYLCIHGAKSGWSQLNWVCDVAELIRRYPELDWQSLFEQAGESGYERILSIGCALPHRLLDTPLPEWVLRRIRSDATSQALTQQLCEQLFCEPERDFSLQLLRFHLAAMNRWQDQLRYCMRALLHFRLLTPTFNDFAFLQLPDQLHFLYYLIRPLRLLLKLCGYRNRTGIAEKFVRAN
jgi:hypothetical protein